MDRSLNAASGSTAFISRKTSTCSAVAAARGSMEAANAEVPEGPLKESEAEAATDTAKVSPGGASSNVLRRRAAVGATPSALAAAAATAAAAAAAAAGMSFLAPSSSDLALSPSPLLLLEELELLFSPLLFPSPLLALPGAAKPFSPSVAGDWPFSGPSWAPGAEASGTGPGVAVSSGADAFADFPGPSSLLSWLLLLLLPPVAFPSARANVPGGVGCAPGLAGSCCA
mmetsp:Transcript_72819/g.158072  ORF Transcript_72819/g.158072 Transcript_72819/m.158072 type:complete len:228 (-) Transcript_72819:1032-1715(-)